MSRRRRTSTSPPEASVVRAARIWLGFEPDRTSQTVSGSARQLLDDEPIVQLGLCQVF